MNPFQFYQPATAGEAYSQTNGHAHAKYIAGGTNLLDLMKYRITLPDTVVDINRLDTYKSISPQEDGSVIIGSLVSNAATAYHPLIEQHYPLLSRAILAGASPQIRNMATNGGNLLQRTRCYYFYDVATPCNKRNPGTGCSALTGYTRNMAVIGTSEECIAVFPSDMCIALSALDATVLVTGPDGDRSIPFNDFHRLPGDTPHIDNNLRQAEIITGIQLPAEGFAEYYSYLKLRDRSSYAFALVSVATAFKMDGDQIREARIALGGIAHKPWRVNEAEQLLIGKPATRETLAMAADRIMEGAVGFEHNDFKIPLAKKAIVRNGLMALNPSTQTPGAGPSNEQL